MQPPLLCLGYQNGTYNITIYSSMNEIVEKIGPRQYTQTNNYSRTLIQEEVTLQRDTDSYSPYLRVLIDFESIGVTISNDSIVIIGGKSVSLNCAWLNLKKLMCINLPGVTEFKTTNHSVNTQKTTTGIYGVQCKRIS